MYGWSKLNKNESGQAALEAAIILIAFVVVASVFAFAILSAGSASTEKGEQAIYAGLEGVQSSMEIKGAVTAYNGAVGSYVANNVVFTVALAGGGSPVNIADDAATSDLVIAYRDNDEAVSALDFTVNEIKGDGDDLLEDGELMEVVVDLALAADGTTATDIALEAGTNFTLEVKPPTGGILNINRTLPAVLETVMEIR